MINMKQFLKLSMLLLLFLIPSVSAASIDSVILNATSLNNLTNDNLTAYPQNPSLANVSVLYEWFKNGLSGFIILGNATDNNILFSSFTSEGETWFVNATPKNLTNNYDISNASFNDIFSVSGQDILPVGMALNNDGSKLYVIGAFGDAIYEYTLSTAFDVSTGTFNDLFNVSAQETDPSGMAFNNDGTKVYVIGLVGQDINEYNLSTPFDVSTGVFNDLFDVSAQETVLRAMAFNNDGTKLYVIGTTGDDVNEYNLSTPFDVSTGVFNDLFDVSAQDTSPRGMAFNNDGTKLYVIGADSDNVNEYNLSTAFDVSTGAFNDLFSIGTQETAPQGMAFNNDGTKLYVIGSTGDDINEYDIGSVQTGTTVQSNNLTILALSIDSVILNATSANNFSSDNLTANPQNTTPANAGILYEWFKDGLSGFTILGNATSNNILFSSFTSVGETWFVNATPKVLTNNYDVSLGTVNDLFDVSGQESAPTGMAFNNDGTKIYVIGEAGQDINEYNLSTAFDVSTGVFNDLFDVSSQDTSPLGMAFNNDGSKLYVIGATGQDINEYNLPTAFDVSTGVFNDLFDVSGQETIPVGMAFNNDGTKLYVVGETGQDINEYNLPTAFDVSTGTFVDTFSVSGQETTPTGMAFNNDGSKLYVVGNTGQDINEYNLSTAFDVSTGVFNDLFSVSGQEATPQGMAFNNDGSKLYVIGTTGDDINEYDIGSVVNGVTVQSNNLTILDVTETSSTETSTSSGNRRSCSYDSDYDWECSEWNICINGEQTRTCKETNNCKGTFGRPEITRTCEPTQLLDISFSLDDSIVSNSDELSVVVTFESFGTVPTPVDLIFIVLDEFETEVYREKSKITVTTEEVLRKSFGGLNLPQGKYILVLQTLYNTNVSDEFRQEFEIGKERRGITGRVVDFIGGEGKWWIVGVIVFVGLVWWLVVRKRNKN